MKMEKGKLPPSPTEIAHRQLYYARRRAKLVGQDVPGRYRNPIAKNIGVEITAEDIKDVMAVVAEADKARRRGKGMGRGGWDKGVPRGGRMAHNHVGSTGRGDSGFYFKHSHSGGGKPHTHSPIRRGGVAQTNVSQYWRKGMSGYIKGKLPVAPSD